MTEGKVNRGPIWADLRRRRGEVKDVPEAWLVGTTPAEIYPRDCYMKSFQYLTQHLRDDPAPWLVHGGMHAWVEMPDGTIFCGVLQHFFKPRPYYAAWRVVPEYKYDPGAAGLLLRRLSALVYGKDGPAMWGGWEEYLGLTPPRPGEGPHVIDYARARELLEELDRRRETARGQ
jgi:hypothetical protein